jgi:hypothetical protein
LQPGGWQGAWKGVWTGAVDLGRGGRFVLEIRQRRQQVGIKFWTLRGTMAAADMDTVEAETLAELEEQEHEAGEKEREARRDVRKRKREMEDAVEECAQADRVQRMASARLKAATTEANEAETKARIARGRRAHLRQRMFLHPDMPERRQKASRKAVEGMFAGRVGEARTKAPEEMGAYVDEVGMEVMAFVDKKGRRGVWRGFVRGDAAGGSGGKPDYGVWVRYVLEEAGVDELTGELNGGWEATLQAEVGGEVVCTMHAHSDDAPCFKVCVLDEQDASNRIAPELQRFLPGPDYALNENGKFLRALVQGFPWGRLATGSWLLGAGVEVVAPIGFALPDGFGKPLN